MRKKVIPLTIGEIFTRNIHTRNIHTLSKQSKLKSTILSKLHSTLTAGHFGFTKTYDRVKRSFFWDGMKQDIRNFVTECDVCQRNKGETVKSPGTLQPLKIPPTIWRDISMDFITGLPK